MTLLKANFAVKPNKLNMMIGLARRAGKTVCGAPLVFIALREHHKPALVLLSDGASEATKKKVTSKCAYYRVPLISVPIATDELAKAVGKSGELAAVAVTDDNFKKAILSAAELTGKDGTPLEAPKQ